MIEQIGNLRSRKTVGSGMIRFVCSNSPSTVQVGERKAVVGSVNGGALPALSCQVWKCIVSVGPMLSRMRSTSGSSPAAPGRRRGSCRLVQSSPKWKAAVLAIACRCLLGRRSASFRGIAGCVPTARSGTACGKLVAQIEVLRVAAVPRPPAGIDGQLHQVGQPADLRAPVALLLGSVRNWSRLIEPAPCASRYALMNVAWLCSSSALSWMYWLMSSSSTERAFV